MGERGAEIIRAVVKSYRGHILSGKSGGRLARGQWNSDAGNGHRGMSTSDRGLPKLSGKRRQLSSSEVVKPTPEVGRRF